MSSGSLRPSGTGTKSLYSARDPGDNPNLMVGGGNPNPMVGGGINHMQKQAHL